MADVQTEREREAVLELVRVATKPVEMGDIHAVLQAAGVPRSRVASALLHLIYMGDLEWLLDRRVQIPKGAA